MERLPDQAKVSVVHGDYGLHNCRVASDGHIAAVVDWEISTLGDPLADLAYGINAWVESPDEVAGQRPAADRRCPASPAAQELSTATRERTGADLSQLEYYRCFNHWKTVCIMQGVYARYLHGQKDTEGVEHRRVPRPHRPRPAPGRRGGRAAGSVGRHGR